MGLLILISDRRGLRLVELSEGKRRLGAVGNQGLILGSSICEGLHARSIMGKNHHLLKELISIFDFDYICGRILDNPFH